MPVAASAPGHCILSHGLDSGPGAAKVTALDAVARRLGWTCERPDYTDLDALGDFGARLDRLLGLARVAAERGPLVLAGSSLGAWVSGMASVQVPVAGLFLMAPPIRMHDAQPLRAAPVPTTIVHGWRDELIPVARVVEWAAARRDRLLLVDDTHRLAANVEACAAAFGALLAGLADAR